MRVYLSGPMTGMPELNFPAFHAAAAFLRGHGYEVINPAECMRADIKALCDCDAIVLMYQWEISKGAHLELHIAHRLGLQVLHLTHLQAKWATNLTRHQAARGFGMSCAGRVASRTERGNGAAQQLALPR